MTIKDSIFVIMQQLFFQSIDVRLSYIHNTAKKVKCFACQGSFFWNLTCVM